jgi:AcrR family transcriptional regulator
MKRRRSSLKDRMVQAAVEMFAEHGFTATSTREIARRARISEVSIYRYFPRKQKLFWAALQSRLEHLRLDEELQSGLLHDSDPQIVVPMLIRFLVEAATEHPELMRMLYISLVELGPRSERVCEEYVSPTFQTVSAYMQRGMETGRLRRLDPLLSVLAFMGTVLNHDNLHVLFTGKPIPYASIDELLAAYSGFWLDVLLPPSLAQTQA